MTIVRKSFACGASSGLACLLVVGALPAQARTLSMSERVAAQKAIEQVYWSHRIWPKENPGPKPPLSAVMTDEVIRAKVEDYLKKSNALEKWWQRPVTAEQLQAELDRMAQGTKDGATLQELFFALGDDPFVIAETLARETLVDRLILNWYANDTRFHGELKAKAEAALAACPGIDCMKTMGGEYREATSRLRDGNADAAETGRDEAFRLGAGEWNEQLGRLAAQFGVKAGALPTGRLSGLEETSDAFIATAVRSQKDGELVTASVAWPKRSFGAWWTGERGAVRLELTQPAGTYTTPAVPRTTCTADTWSPTRIGAADPVSQHTAVWTGTEMIVWGGDYGNTVAAVNSGGRYVPATDSWTLTSTGTNVPSARDHHTAVWTGTQMIVWGGGTYSAPKLNTGGRYNPSTDTWVATSTGVNVPEARDQHTAVWTGTEMIVWGGYNGSTELNSGGRYNPTTDSWTATSTGTNVPAARRGHTAVWTGSRMVVWGGYIGFTTYFNTGGVYNPTSNSWTATSTGTNVPLARGFHTAMWSGTEMIVWGGYADSVYLNTGARYNPSTDHWALTSTVNSASARRYHTAVWTGTEMIVWGGDSNGSYSSTGARYKPSTDSWVATSTGANVPPLRVNHTAVWTGTEMIVWGGGVSTGGRYDPSTDSWVATSIGASVPAARNSHTAVWTGAEMIVWGGTGTSLWNTGGRYSPATDSWSTTSTGTNVPTSRSQHTAIWTGTEMIVWGGVASVSGLNTGGRYNPASDSWTPTSVGVNLPGGRYSHEAVWTGKEMLVWGGNAGSYVYPTTGGRYRPSADSWSSMSASNVPAGREDFSSVWTGTEMIVWGGFSYTGSQNWWNTGGRYDPLANTWSLTSTGVNTPVGREAHTAVWTGTEMIVWGGGNMVADPYKSTGGRYDPVANAWAATSTGANMPSPRNSASAVWTGSEMIVWGGSGSTGNLSTGGRYSPATDTWTATPTATNLPSGRNGHTVVWTGTEMIVWGGSPTTATGGRYCACPSGHVFYHDVDGDGFGDAGNPYPSCDGTQPAGGVDNSTDCNDANASIHPGAAEPCDGLDHNCDGVVVNPPTEIGAVSVAGGATTTLTWAGQGVSTRYDIASSTLSDLAANQTSSATCFANDVAVASVGDGRPNPPAGDGYYYLVRAQNGCGAGSYGFATSGAERIPAAACP